MEGNSRRRGLARQRCPSATALLAACVIAQLSGVRGSASVPVVPVQQVPGGAAPVSITVPGHFENFKEAIEKMPPDAGIIMVQPGEHRWDNFIEIGNRVSIHGAAGTVLPGSIWMKKGSGGDMQGIEMVKESGSCIIFEGGQWNIDQCRLCCSRWAVLWARCESEVTIKNCFLGGMEDGPGYCLNCQDHARVTVDGCHLERSGGEFSAAVAVFHSVRARVHACNFQDNLFAFRAVTAKDASLEVVGNSIQGDLWFDSTRPGSLVEQSNTHNGVPLVGTGALQTPDGLPLRP